MPAGWIESSYPNIPTPPGLLLPILVSKSCLLPGCQAVGGHFSLQVTAAPHPISTRTIPNVL